MKTNTHSLWFRNSTSVTSSKAALVHGFKVMWAQMRTAAFSLIERKNLTYTMYPTRSNSQCQFADNTLILFWEISCTNPNGWDHVKLNSLLTSFYLCFSEEQQKLIKIKWRSFTPKVTSLKRLSTILAASTLRDVEILLLVSLVWKVSDKFFK